MSNWHPMKPAPKGRIWLLLNSGVVAFGRWKKNPPRAYLPGHWVTDLGVCSSQSELGEPVAWRQAEIPAPPPANSIGARDDN